MKKIVFDNDSKGSESSTKSEYLDYLHDESKLAAKSVNEIFFPENTIDVLSIIQTQIDPNQKFVISGSRTGLVGGAVPLEQDMPNAKVSLVSLERMKQIFGVFDLVSGKAVKLQSGVTLWELQEYLDEHNPEWFFPVDPTEGSASFGGMVSTNASGARGYRYGALRDWVYSLTVVLADGSKHVVTRGEDRLDGFKLDFSGFKGELAEIWKPGTKNSIGYSCSKDMDLVDLFIGAEGTLGVVTEVSLLLLKKPSRIFSCLQFFTSDEEAIDFVDILRQETTVQFLSIEFFDRVSLEIAAQSSGAIGSEVLERIREGLVSAVYFEVATESYDRDITLVVELMESAQANIESSIFAESMTELDSLKRFRHAVPEGINKIIAERKKKIPSLRKIATDMAVPNEFLRPVLKLYKEVFGSAGLEFSVLGHAGNNHFHVNILPRSESEMQLALTLYFELAKKIVAMKGAVAAEHGIGRVKKNLLLIQYSPEVLMIMGKIKSILDPSFRFNPGVLLFEGSSV